MDECMNSLGVHGQHGRQNGEVGYQHRMMAKGEEIRLATPYLTESSGILVLGSTSAPSPQSHCQSGPLCLVIGSELEQTSSEQWLDLVFMLYAEPSILLVKVPEQQGFS